MDVTSQCKETPFDTLHSFVMDSIWTSWSPSSKPPVIDMLHDLLNIDAQNHQESDRWCLPGCHHSRTGRES